MAGSSRQSPSTRSGIRPLVVGERSDAGLGQLERSFVFGAHGLVEEPPITQAHLGRDVAEKCHEALERHPGVHHGGREGVAKLVAGHVPEPGHLGGAAELEAQAPLAESAAVVGEEELGRTPVAGMKERTSLGARGDDAVDEGDCLVVEGDHPLGVELAERDFQPRAVARDLVHAVEFEVQELSDAKPTGPLQQERIGGQAVFGTFERLGEAPVGVDGQITREGREGVGYRSGRRACGRVPAPSPIR